MASAHDLHRVVLDSHVRRSAWAALHHGPTKGGAVEAGKFTDRYERTIESYRETFGQQPPGDIWPNTELRFANADAWKRLDTSQFWLIPKARLIRIAQVGAALVALGLLGAGCRDVLGEDASILEVFYLFLVVAVVITLLVRFLYWWYTDGGDGGGSGCSSGAGGGGGCGGAGCGVGGCSS